MDNPCRECLVSPTCSQVCWKKENYSRLLRDAIQRYRSFQRVCEPRRNQKLKNYLYHYINLDEINSADLSLIRNRR